MESRGFLQFERQASTEGAAGTGTVLRPMKDLLPRYDAFEVHNRARERAKLQSSVWKVDGYRCISQCELI